MARRKKDKAGGAPPPPTTTARNRAYTLWVVLAVGILCGLLVGLLLTQVDESQKEKAAAELLSYFPAFSEFNTSMYFRNFSLSLLRLQRSSPTVGLRPGIEASQKGMKPWFPVVCVPGIVSAGLELWKGKPCAAKYFRQRMWGTLNMMQSILLDRDCWLEHMALNETTGLDPDAIKLRAAMGLEAADYLFPGFWVWAKMIENLADIGYDSTTLTLISHDWRLSFQNTERRDGYLSRLKSEIELMHHVNGRRVVVLTHSWGSNLMFFFLNWVGHAGHGGGGPAWVEEHVEAVANIGGPLLGLSKSLSSLLSGEMKDTADLGALQDYLVDRLVSRKQLRKLFRSWGSIGSMLPKGGNAIWGDEAGAPDDPLHTNMPTCIDGSDGHVCEESENVRRPSFGCALRLCELEECACLPMEAALAHLDNTTVDTPFSAFLHSEFTFGRCADRECMRQHADSPAAWANPLMAALPAAPSTKLYSLYGVGLSTERAYYYRTLNASAESYDPTTPTVIHPLHNNPAFNISNGVLRGDGDGTVPLTSLGFMGAHGWTALAHLFNPGGVQVVVREYASRPSAFYEDPRGGPCSADHVDILGNFNLTWDILRIVSNTLPESGRLESVYVSDIQQIAAKVKL